jgi:hypothetical protein
MNEFAKQILEIVTNNPGIKAKDIAKTLGREKTEVNSVL